ncbi:MAG: LysM peptidoglycan-binding domain-containing protein [Gammaproteobacteria bacterium]|jgi:nucleoid-associated protein YgaU
MIFRTTARLLAAAALSLGLLAGCATTGDDGPSAAEQAIADAKAANAEVAAMGYAWRDTGSLIEQAEKALADGDDAKALELANQALAQAEAAKAQAEAEKQKFLDRGGEALAAPLDAGATMGEDSYTVVRGDSLWNISGKSSIYGDSYQWPLIYKANRSQIKDPDLIFPGQTFDIDRNASASEIDAAINHARTRGAWSVGDVEQSDLDYLAK